MNQPETTAVARWLDGAWQWVWVKDHTINGPALMLLWLSAFKVGVSVGIVLTVLVASWLTYWGA